MQKKSPDLIDQLAEHAGVRVDRRPGVDLIAVEDAGPFLDACAARGVRILGLEGFYLRNDEIHVDLDRITDLSSIADASESIAEARRAIEAIRVPELLLDFTLDQP